MIYQNSLPSLADGGPRLPDSLVQRFPVGQQALAANGRPRHLLMLGGSVMQLPAIRMAKEEGWKVILADGNANAIARPWVDFFEHVDLKDTDALLAMARSYHCQGNLHGVFTAGTDFSASVAWVSEALGLPGIPYEAALNASNKLRMRRIFQEKEIPSPAFLEFGHRDNPDAAMLAKISLPAVIKPIDNMGARGVRRIDDWRELPAALDAARGFSRRGSVILEEFIQGPEYSIDSLVIDGELIPCGLAVRHVRFPPNFVEVGHTIPSDLDPAQAEHLVKVFSRAVAALGITFGAAKGDVFMTPHGPMIGEIAARLSGGYMSGWTFPLASGVELTRAALYLAMGLPVPSLATARHEVCAERALISIPGRVQALENLASALSPETVTHFFGRVAPGDQVVFPRNNVEKAGNILAVHPDRQSAIHAAQSAVANCLIRLEPNNPITEDWLFNPGPEQAPAYPGLKKMLPLPADFKLGRKQLVADHQIMAEEDWTWRTLTDTLGWLDHDGWKILIQLSDSKRIPSQEIGRFWQALAQGGLQAALYVIDTWAIRLAGTET